MCSRGRGVVQRHRRSVLVICISGAEFVTAKVFGRFDSGSVRFVYGEAGAEDRYLCFYHGLDGMGRTGMG